MVYLLIINSLALILMAIFVLTDIKRCHVCLVHQWEQCHPYWHSCIYRPWQWCARQWRSYLTQMKASICAAEISLHKNETTTPNIPQRNFLESKDSKANFWQQQSLFNIAIFQYKSVILFIYLYLPSFFLLCFPLRSLDPNILISHVL